MINFNNEKFTAPLASVVAAVNDFTDSYRKYPSSFRSPKKEVLHPTKIYRGAVKYILDYLRPSKPSLLVSSPFLGRFFGFFERGSLLNADHYIARNPISMRELGVDFLLARGSTFYAPYGGIICVVPRDSFPDVHMEVSQCPDMIPVVAMAEALRSLRAVTFPIINQKEKSLCSYITKKLCRSTRVNITPRSLMEQTYYVNLNLTTKNISPPVLAKRLEGEGIFVGYDHHNDGLKLSFSFMNSKEEIDLFVEKLNLFI